ncbi:MAG TPA: tetratricopeptide repeat protein [Gammaproteobacteria bacterium]|nr:tetratricopeptide repeat protein [Gammaproteobacteria bacterium]
MSMRTLIRILILSCLLATAAVAQAVTVPLNQGLLSSDTYQRLNSAQHLIASGQYDDALTRLNSLAPRVQSNSYEYAVTLQNIAYVYISRGDFNSALPYMNRAMRENAMPPAAQRQLVLDLGKLYARAGQYSDAQRVMGVYLKAESNPPPDADMLIALTDAKLGQCRSALPYAKRALENNSTAPESWYQLWIACAYTAKQYNSAIDGLYAALGRWPDNANYWRQLGQTYAQNDEQDKALGVFALMYRQGLAQNEQDYLNLVSLYMQNNEPYEAANVLQKGLEAGVVGANEDNYDLLAATWLDAKEYDKAIASLGEAAKYAKTGDAYLKQAQLYQQSHEWFSVVKATQRALQKGSLHRPGRAWLLQGVAQAENKQYPEAAAALKEAAKYEDVKGEAETWIRFVDARANQSF